jgi:hypothetical protein
MVPFSDCTCRNLGVLANAQIRRVQSEDQSGRYTAPISSAWERNLPLSGFTNPDSTKTTPSCPNGHTEIGIIPTFTKPCTQRWGSRQVPEVWRNPALFEPSRESSPHVSSSLDPPRCLRSPSTKGGSSFRYHCRDPNSIPAWRRCINLLENCSERFDEEENPH